MYSIETVLLCALKVARVNGSQQRLSSEVVNLCRCSSTKLRGDVRTIESFCYRWLSVSQAGLLVRRGLWQQARVYVLCKLCHKTAKNGRTMAGVGGLSPNCAMNTRRHGTDTALLTP